MLICMKSPQKSVENAQKRFKVGAGSLRPVKGISLPFTRPPFVLVLRGVVPTGQVGKHEVTVTTLRGFVANLTPTETADGEAPRSLLLGSGGVSLETH